MIKDNCCNEPCHSQSNENRRWLKIGLWLIIFTILYNLAEAVVAVFSGVKADSIALVGFGLDSLIEVSAAILLLWRLIIQLKRGSDETVEQAEETVHRFVGVTFFLLAIYVSIEAISALFFYQPAQESLIGIILALLSLVIMPLLAWGKIHAAREINSAALKAEAKETIACSILSLILLIGLIANATVGWWWADPVAGLCMVPWLIKEGLAGIKGEGCCG